MTVAAKGVVTLGAAPGLATSTSQATSTTTPTEAPTYTPTGASVTRTLARGTPDP